MKLPPASRAAAKVVTALPSRAAAAARVRGRAPRRCRGRRWAPSCRPTPAAGRGALEVEARSALGDGVAQPHVHQTSAPAHSWKAVVRSAWRPASGRPTGRRPRGRGVLGARLRPTALLEGHRVQRGPRRRRAVGLGRGRVVHLQGVAGRHGLAQRGAQLVPGGARRGDLGLEVGPGGPAPEEDVDGADGVGLLAHEGPGEPGQAAGLGSSGATRAVGGMGRRWGWGGPGQDIGETLWVTGSQHAWRPW